MLNYLAVYLDRVDSIEKLAKTDERVPVFDTFPEAFTSALSEEIEARQKLEITISPLSCLP